MEDLGLTLFYWVCDDFLLSRKIVEGSTICVNKKKHIGRRWSNLWSIVNISHQHLDMSLWQLARGCYETLMAWEDVLSASVDQNDITITLTTTLSQSTPLSLSLRGNMSAKWLITSLTSSGDIPAILQCPLIVFNLAAIKLVHVGSKNDTSREQLTTIHISPRDAIVSWTEIDDSERSG
jgi:hypothetical protein